MAVEITRTEVEGMMSWIPRLTYNAKNLEIVENYYFKHLKGIGQLEGTNINLELWKRIEKTIQLNTRREYLNSAKDKYDYYWRVYEKVRLKGVKIYLIFKNPVTNEQTKKEEVKNGEDIIDALEQFKAEYNKKVSIHNLLTSIIKVSGPIKNYIVKKLVSKKKLERLDEAFFVMMSGVIISMLKERVNPLYIQIEKYSKNKNDRKKRFETIKQLVKNLRDICLIIVK